MEWRTLEQHFRNGTRPDPSPVEDGAIEWDYSRYSRALGLSGPGGLHEQPFTGLVVVSAAPRRWDELQHQYERWADGSGWDVLTVSARPTVMVPDPVVFGLGAAVARPDALLFARSGRFGQPAPGRRGAARSAPLSASERWLIASDRVRRRLRTEAARRGLVVLIDEAHKLTAAALNQIAYHLNAHRAWKARMLSRDARIYFVMLTTPERESVLREALRRRTVTEGVEYVREAARDPADAPPPSDVVLGAEEEHILSALYDAPLAPTRADVARIFGRSSLEVAAELIARRVLSERTEDGTCCFVPNPRRLPPLPPSPPRVQRAILELYRRRARRGHAHVAVAAATAYFRNGEPLRALAYIDRADSASSALVPLDLHHELDAQLSRYKKRLRTRHHAFRVALHAHQHDYDAARRLTTAVGETPLHSEADLAATLSNLLCLGRTHLDQILPPGFWATLHSRSPRLPTALVDGTCILAELFARLRLMTTQEVRDRYEVAQRCLAGVASSQHSRLGAMVSALHYRAVLFLTPTTLRMDAARLPKLRDATWAGHLNAYIVATIAYAEDLFLAHGDMPGYEAGATRDINLTAATGTPADRGIQLGAVLSREFKRGHVLLLRGIGDELVLLLPWTAPNVFRRRLCRLLQSISGHRVWLSTTSSLLASASVGGARPGSFEAAALARALLAAEDYSGSRSVLDRELEHPSASSEILAMVLFTRIQWARRAVKWQEFAAIESLIRQHAARLPVRLENFLLHYMVASRALCQGRDASRPFELAASQLGRPTAGERAIFLDAARRDMIRSARLHAWLANVRAESFADLIPALTAPIPGRARAGTSPGQLASSLEFIVVGLEACASKLSTLPRDAAFDTVLRVRNDLDRALQGAASDVVQALSEWAPTFYSWLLEELVTTLGAFGAGDNRVAVRSALGVLAHTWRERQPRAANEWVVSPSPARTRREAVSRGRWWRFDPSTFFRASELVARKEPGEIIVFESVRSNAPRCTRVSVALPHPRVESERVRGEVTVELWGVSPTSNAIRESVRRAGRCGYPVLVTGETGVGKEMVARAIHQGSARRSGPFVVAECAAMVESLVESQLFGHVRGAFTGAVDDHRGLFANADTGSLLLDSLELMSRRMQALLLRVLESGEYRAVGSQNICKTGARIIATCSSDLADLVQRGEFRDDLYYRLSTLIIDVPPLRDRPGDTRHLAVRFAARLGLHVSPAALAYAEECSWPGNVRQLRQSIEVASTTASHGEISRSDLVRAIGDPPARSGPPPQRVGSAQAALIRTRPALDAQRDFDSNAFAQAAGLSRRSAQRYLAQLVAAGALDRRGTGRATRYVVRGDA